VTNVTFSFSDTVAGYVTRQGRGYLDLRGLDDEPVRVEVDSTTSAQYLRNLGQPYQDAIADLHAGRIGIGALIFAYGPLVPAECGGHRHHVSSLIIAGQAENNPILWPEWWISQLEEIANFYRLAQFGTDPVNFRQYRTQLTLSGDKTSSSVQETDTISRLVYGMATSYMLTGNEDYLDVAQAGSTYMQQHLRVRDPQSDITYWLHGLDLRNEADRTLLSSEFGDDYHALPAYEQIYALAGLVQTYRVTGERSLLQDIDGTMRLFDRYYRDPGLGGYYSHVDPITLSPHSDQLGANRSRKNWNSIGDHAPAYLFNLFLATGDAGYLTMIKHCFDMILTHFPEPDSDLTPFVRERFHADWTVDESWGWQQNRAVVGHNLKIVWNLLRMAALCDDNRYINRALDIANALPRYGLDWRRGGWYDVLERTDIHDAFVWHDRKAWWQQEQAILAYLLMASYDAPRWQRNAFEAMAFYNAHFLDHDDGGILFTVLANGIPFLDGDERRKGSHAMSMYHSAELCFLASVYTGLLLRDEPLTLWFRPSAMHGFPGGLLRVAPDAFPTGRVAINKVRIDGSPHDDFDPWGLTVTLPRVHTDVTVQVELGTSPDRISRS